MSPLLWRVSITCFLLASCRIKIKMPVQQQQKARKGHRWNYNELGCVCRCNLDTFYHSFYKKLSSIGVRIHLHTKLSCCLQDIWKCFTAGLKGNIANPSHFIVFFWRQHSGSPVFFFFINIAHSVQPHFLQRRSNLVFAKKNRRLLQNADLIHGFKQDLQVSNINLFYYFKLKC